MRKQLGSHYAETVARRGKPKAQYDQLYATRGTVLDRVGMLRQYGDLRGRDILLIGDDDLVSIAMEDLLPPREQPNSVTVLDIDENLLEAIANSTTSGIRTMKYDVRKRLPIGLLHEFDTVFMDPPYTVAGQHAFALRALQALRQTRKCVRSVLWTCYSEADLTYGSMREIQKDYNRLGFVLEELWRNWNHYEAARRRKSEKRIQRFSSNLFRYVLAPFAGARGKRGASIYRYDK